MWNCPHLINWPPSHKIIFDQEIRILIFAVVLVLSNCKHQRNIIRLSIGNRNWKWSTGAFVWRAAYSIKWNEFCGNQFWQWIGFSYTMSTTTVLSGQQLSVFILVMIVGNAFNSKKMKSMVSWTGNFLTTFDLYQVEQTIFQDKRENILEMV